MKNVFLVAFCTLFAFSMNAQSVHLDGVKGSKFTGVKPILSETDASVSGYYTYYMAEREKKGMRTFEFAIIDKGVTKINTIPISMHKWARLNTTVFNGKYFLISYDDTKNKKLVYNVIDLDGKIIKTKEIPVDKKRNVVSTVYPAAKGTGYYVVKPIAEKKRRGFSIELLDNNLTQKWKIEEVGEKGVRQVADLVNSEDRFVIWKEVGLSIKKLKPEIVCFDAKTGKKIFSRDGYDGTSTIMYNQLRLDADGGIIAGGSYVDGEKYKAVNFSGIYMLKLSPQGKEMIYSKVDNAEKIQAVLKATSKGATLGSKDKIWVEDIIVDGDSYVIISEMFRKNLNPKPQAYQGPRDLISGKFIGDITYKDQNGKHPKCTFEIMDYMLFKFNPKGELSEIKPITKDGYTKLTVYYPYVGLYGMSMAKVVERLGWFDYGFTETNDKGQKIMVCSNNSEARKPQVYTYAFDENFSQKQINLRQEGKVNLEEGRVGYFKTMRNSNGKIAVAYYQRKLKRITVNIESLD